jgi:hypothetical protein
LVLTRDQFAVDNDTRIISAPGPGIKRAVLFKNCLWKMWNQEPAPKHGLQFSVALQCVSGHMAAANPVGYISEGDGAVADGSAARDVHDARGQNQCHPAVFSSVLTVVRARKAPRYGKIQKTAIVIHIT